MSEDSGQQQKQRAFLRHVIDGDQDQVKDAIRKGHSSGMGVIGEERYRDEASELDDTWEISDKGRKLIDGIDNGERYREEIARQSPAMDQALRLMNGEPNIISQLFGTQETMPDFGLDEHGEVPTDSVAYDFDSEHPDEDWLPNAEFPDRPTHPNFREMVEIIHMMDSIAESKGWEHVFLSMDVDPASIRYLSHHRAVHRAKQLLGNATEDERLMIMWIDAFTLGAKMMEGRRTLEVVLDESVDTHHRMRGHE